ncbi:hypothetical protein SAMN02745885_02091 [Carboxydocella sporoproducens DSM 16521]|uniref:Uncharacterized protein n=2 Tax=Carboxydocella TaxID=178898 RepID=A0A1T4RH32_9FIRM|nr:hypothetical protein [Carboxydocella sporoproducens]SKA14961.1 hypothetical protein SAMN02745885_02091 [Carboxydocella sporoproducens DSM 16521]
MRKGGLFLVVRNYQKSHELIALSDNPDRTRDKRKVENKFTPEKVYRKGFLAQNKRLREKFTPASKCCKIGKRHPPVVFIICQTQK